MCIIAAKRAGLDLPMENRMWSMWECNSDGAGFMVRTPNNDIIIRKGFMNYDDLMEAVNKMNEYIDLKNSDMVFHFRYATHGGIQASLTHPFVLSDNYNEMKELQNSSPNVIGIAHNGVYPYNTPLGVSDSMVYIKEKIYPLYKKDKKFYDNDEKMRTLQGKLAFLTKDGIRLIGSFIEDPDDGIFYSNETYTFEDWWYDEEESYNCCESGTEDFDFGKFSDLIELSYFEDSFYSNKDYGKKKIEDLEELSSWYYEV